MLKFLNVHLYVYNLKHIEQGYAKKQDKYHNKFTTVTRLSSK